MHPKKQKRPEVTPAFPLRGVGKQIAKHLARLDIYSVPDLLFHLPSRYQDRTHVEPIRQLIPGKEAVIEGVIEHVAMPKQGRTKLLCELKDETGMMHLRFFHVLSFQVNVLKPGTRLRCYGEVRWGPKKLVMFHPEFQIIRDDQGLPLDQHLTPIYPATEGLSQHMLRKLTLNALAWMENENAFRELLPATLLKQLDLPTFKEALRFIHRPPRETVMPQLLDYKTHSQKRLVFEELLAHRISLLHIKQSFQSRLGIPLTKHQTLSSQFRQFLPFQLTSAQERVTQEIKEDLIREHPMLRLVQGDVGSGKTVIAALAMLQAVENGYQAAMMAPTELLAEQHYRVFKRWLDPLGVRVAFLSSSVKGSERTTALKAIKKGEANIVLGTHALFQEEVIFFQTCVGDSG